MQPTVLALAKGIDTVRPMNLDEQLGYRIRESKGLVRALAKLAATKPISTPLSLFLHDVDRAVLKMTRGRTTATALLTGLPVLWLTTTGARSGEPRTFPLFGIPYGSGMGLIGARFGSAPTPSWVFNLRAHPEATVRWRETEVRVRARSVDDLEAAAIWEKASLISPGFPVYRERVTHRKIEVFLLEMA